MTVESINQRQLRILLNKLFNSFPVSEGSRGAKMEAYMEALARIPFLFVEKAILMGMRGRIGEGHFCPTVGELAKLAEELQWQARRREQPRRLPEMSVSNSPEQRNAIIVGFHRLLTDLKSGKTINPDLATAQVFKITKVED